MNRAALLLADPSPCLRRRVLMELLERPVDDPEVRELGSLTPEDPLVGPLLAFQRPDGSWRGRDFPALPQDNPLLATAAALHRLGYLGFGPETPAVQRGAQYLFSRQKRDGSWPLPRNSDEGSYSMVPLQTSLPLQGLAFCGYATDPRAEQAYDWLLERRTPEGSWPTGSAAGTYGFVAGYRRLPHSRWGCRSNTTAALLCLAAHPQRCRSAEARRGLDLLLARESRERHHLGFEVARRIGLEPVRGFFARYARFDPALILALCVKIGAHRGDERVAELVQFIRRVQGPYGLWEYLPDPRASTWISFELLHCLAGVDASTDWISMEPRTPFQAYGRRRKRY